ncbi:MAG: hypothetical protein ACYDGY_10570 [Acidimicrobiales bacterium]
MIEAGENMAEGVFQAGTSEGQATSTELVKSMALSSAELWREVLDRLTQVQQSQSALARSIDDLGTIIKAALPSLSEGASGTVQAMQAPHTVPDVAGRPLRDPLMPGMPGTPVSDMRAEVARPPSAVAPPNPFLPSPPGSLGDAPVAASAPAVMPPQPGALQRTTTPPPSGPAGLPPRDLATPPQATAVSGQQAPRGSRQTPATKAQKSAGRESHLLSSPADAPEPLFFVPPLVASQTSTAAPIPGSAANPVTSQKAPSKQKALPAPGFPVSGPPVPGGTPGSARSGPAMGGSTAPPPSKAAPAPSAGTAMPTLPASQLPSEGITAAPLLSGVTDPLDAILYAEFGDSALVNGAHSTSKDKKSPGTASVSGDQLDTFLTNEFSSTAGQESFPGSDAFAKPPGTAAYPAPAPPRLPSRIPQGNAGFQITPESILEGTRQQKEAASPAPPLELRMPPATHMPAPPLMVPLPAHFQAPEAPSPQQVQHEIAPAKSVVEPPLKPEKLPVASRPLTTPGMPPAAIGFETPEPIMDFTPSQQGTQADSDRFGMANQIFEASPEEPEIEASTEPPIAEDIILGGGRKRGSKLFRH